MVRLGAPQARGRRMGPTGDVHVAAHSETDQVRPLVVSVRPRLPEGRDGDVHQSGVEVAQVAVSKSQGLHEPGLMHLQQHVGLIGKATQQGGAIGGGDIKGDAPTVGGEVEPVEAAIGAGLVVRKGRNMAHGVAAGWLHLDQVGPHIGHQLPAVDAEGA